MEAEGQTIELAVQLGASMLLVIVCTIIHGVGLASIARLLNLNDDRLKEREFDVRGVMLTTAMALCLFVLHMVEIAVFAGFYLLAGAIGAFDQALNYSASAYATLGQTIDYFPDDWSLMGSIESLTGFLLIGWSTAFIVRNVSLLRGE